MGPKAFILSGEQDEGRGWERGRAMAYESLDRITAEKISAVGIPSDEAERLHRGLARILGNHGNSCPETWREISRRLLSPDLPFPFHLMMYYGSYKGYGSVTPPAWIPDKWALWSFCLFLESNERNEKYKENGILLDSRVLLLYLFCSLFNFYSHLLKNIESMIAYLTRFDFALVFW